MPKQLITAPAEPTPCHHGKQHCRVCYWYAGQPVEWWEAQGRQPWLKKEKTWRR